MKSLQALLSAMLLALAVMSASAAESSTYEGGILINAKFVMIGNKDYPWNSSTKCRDQEKVKMTCETLAQVGYADRARVVVSDGTVTNIDVLVLHQ